jgi:hypothetical protein
MTWCGAVTLTLSYIVTRTLSYTLIGTLSYIVIRTLSYIVILNLIEDPYTSGYFLRRISLNQKHSLCSPGSPIGVGDDLVWCRRPHTFLHLHPHTFLHRHSHTFLHRHPQLD